MLDGYFGNMKTRRRNIPVTGIAYYTTPRRASRALPRFWRPPVGTTTTTWISCAVFVWRWHGMIEGLKVYMWSVWTIMIYQHILSLILLPLKISNHPGPRRGVGNSQARISVRSTEEEGESPKSHLTVLMSAGWWPGCCWLELSTCLAYVVHVYRLQHLTCLCYSLSSSIFHTTGFDSG
ncbi:hypothetical protein V8F33_001821 [Rhypophila sp. PSN 637]